MALTRNREELRDAVQRTADVVEFTEKHPATYLNDLIDRGLGALSRVCRTVNPEFQPISSTTITTDGNASSYALPSNFRSAISVQYTNTDSDGVKTWLVPYEWHERPALVTPDTVTNATRAFTYKIVGTNIELLPLPPADHTALVWYATTVTQLSNDASTFDTMERLDDYVIWWAARQVSLDRENWERADRLSALMAEMKEEIRILARSLDLSAPSRIVDSRFADRFGRRRWRR